MKSSHSWSETKFRSLAPEARMKAFTRLVADLERQACEGDPSPELLELIARAAAWMDSSDPALLAFSRLAALEPRQMALQAAAWMQSHDPYKRDDGIRIRKLDGSPRTDPHRLKRAKSTVVICEDLRSAFNVGSIFRSAECLGIRELWLCGITAGPGDPALEKTAMGTTGRVAWKRFPTALEAIREAKAQGRIVYALETAVEAVSVFEAGICFPCALVLGNEALGISEAALQAADALIALPVQGWKNSLNVGVAFAVCAYQMIFSGGS